MKRLAAALASCFFLASCGESSPSNVALTRFEGEGFSMEVPKAWVKVDPKTIPAPKKGSVAIALTSTDVSSGFANNLLVLKDSVTAAENGEKMTSARYSVVNHALTTGSYKEYLKLSEKTLNFSDGDEANLYVFEAKYHEGTPKKRFIQTAKICGSSVYLITIGVELDVKESKKYEDLASSFECQAAK